MRCDELWVPRREIAINDFVEIVEQASAEAIIDIYEDVEHHLLKDLGSILE